jgi:mRNA-degrading endonuclease RelE of RelBE toxin-antitoxin system
MFHLVATPGYQRDLRSIIKNNHNLIPLVEDLLDILENDPYNISREHNIKKLTNVAKGAGQWRIRFGKYRLRYDIIEQDVVLFSFSHRKDAY